MILITPGIRYASMIALSEIPLDRLNPLRNVNVTFPRSVAFFVSAAVNAAPTGAPAPGTEARAPAAPCGAATEGRKAPCVARF